jgi:hypothetical protein
MRMHESVVSDYEYRQRVRRYKPSSLVPLIAAAAARYWQQQDWLNSPYRKYTPWALADAARVSLAFGNEHRPDATDQDLPHRSSRWSACGPAGTPNCSAARSGSTWVPPSWPGPVRSAARDGSTLRCSRPRTAG